MGIELPHILFFLAAALLIDCLYGEFPNRFHPVVWIGKSIRLATLPLEYLGAKGQLIGGAMVALLLPCFWILVVSIILNTAKDNVLVTFVLAIFILKSTFALRALGEASLTIQGLLAGGNLDEARFRLRWLCSRDSDQLSEEEIVSASLGSMSENLSDSFVAPLFYFFLFGIEGAVFFRVVNTMDAVIGYRGRYEYMGKAAAKLDDIMGLIPARITALLIIVSGPVLAKSLRQGFKTTLRDHHKTPSPNGGWPMAAFAGVLDTEISKKGVYQLGSKRTYLNETYITEGWHIIKTASGGMIILLIFFLWIFNGYAFF